MRPTWLIAALLLVPIALRAADGSFIPASLEFSVYVVGTPRKVWDALTVKEQVDLYYMCPQQKFELKAGGSVEYGLPGKILLSGSVTEIKEGTHLVYSLSMAHGAETRVEVDLEEVSPGVTALELRQSSGAWGDKDRENYLNGWPVILSGLKTLVETGKPIPWKK